ncbi:hypothetical protein XENTR_v10020945 [Xenopus tropicalis]|nr:hypothetical protein XENTR_v10020945 [Xenopus tropicalis]
MFLLFLCAAARNHKGTTTKAGGIHLAAYPNPVQRYQLKLRGEMSRIWRQQALGGSALNVLLQTQMVQ